ncbi:MAG: hypothetical protein MJY84_03015 [Bacteroidales bacterium]|nr:hypothetical protein [Bacteroidales bacterium]
MNRSFILAIFPVIVLTMSGCHTERSRPLKHVHAESKAVPVPVCHLHTDNSSEVNSGTLFLIDGQWTPVIRYDDPNHISYVLSKIKDAGIRVVCVNCSDFNDRGMGPACIDIIAEVCGTAGMEYFILLNTAHSSVIQDLNRKAGLVLERYAKDKSYRHYGFGDDRPILALDMSGTDYQHLVDSAPDKEKDCLGMFHIGTCQINENQEATDNDGWGYRNMSESRDGAVRFCSPNSGVFPENWSRVDEQEWRRRVKWALGAREYAVLGSYDDTQNALMWGICDVSHSGTPSHINPSTIDKPSIYYDILHDILTKHD